MRESESGRHYWGSSLAGPREEALATRERLSDQAEVVREVSWERAASGCRGQSVALGPRSLMRGLCASVERGGLEHLQTCRERPGQGRGVLGKPLAGSDRPE